MYNDARLVLSREILLEAVQRFFVDFQVKEARDVFFFHVRGDNSAPIK